VDTFIHGVAAWWRINRGYLSEQYNPSLLSVRKMKIGEFSG
jgi:hypothetical protein